MLAIDLCAALLDEVRARKRGLAIGTLQEDLQAFRRHLTRTPEFILCMGDTLSHLENEASVISLIKGASAALSAGGRLVTTFRDHSSALTAKQRFIPAAAATGESSLAS